MVLKIMTEDGWVYFDNIQKLERKRIHYRVKPAKEDVEGGHSKYYDFFIIDSGGKETILYPSDIYMRTISAAKSMDEVDEVCQSDKESR